MVSDAAHTQCVRDSETRLFAFVEQPDGGRFAYITRKHADSAAHIICYRENTVLLCNIIDIVSLHSDSKSKYMNFLQNNYLIPI